MTDEKPEEVKDTETSDLKVNVRSTPMIKKDDASDVQAPTSHKGITIKPLEVNTVQKPEDPVDAPKQSMPETEVVVAEKAELSPDVISLPANPMPDTNGTIEQTPSAVPSVEDKQPVTEQKEAVEPEAIQSPKVFDTKQYHLPINEGVTGRSWKGVAIFLVLLLIVVGVLVAIDADWIDLGFKLPFDLIK